MRYDAVDQRTDQATDFYLLLYGPDASEEDLSLVSHLLHGLFDVGVSRLFGLLC